MNGLLITWSSSTQIEGFITKNKMGFESKDDPSHKGCIMKQVVRTPLPTSNESNGLAVETDPRNA